MTERVEVFGSEGGLVGILAEPKPGDELEDAPAVLLANVGVQHRVGPGRIWVELARRLATNGFRVLRFDLSGMGDSNTRHGGGTEVERGALDLKEAMDHLQQKRGTERFIVIGFCSGTDSAHRITLHDPRVVGMAWVEGYAYRSRRFLLHWYTTRFLDPARWRVSLRKRLAQLSSAAQHPKALGEQDEVFTREYPAADLLARQLEQMLARGVRILAIYSGGADYTYSYAGQFFDMLPGDFRGRVDEHYFPQADHLFSARSHRLDLIASLAAWVDSNFAGRRIARTGT